MCRGSGGRRGGAPDGRLSLTLLGAALLVLAAGVTPHAEPAGPEIQERLVAGPFHFFYWPGQRSAALALARALQPPPNLPGLPPDVLSPGPIEIYLPPDRKTFQDLAPGAPEWSAGLAFPREDRIVLPTYPNAPAGPSIPTVLHHELAHIALRRYLDGAVPRWFHEGYAQLAAGSWDAANAWKLRLALATGRGQSLDSLSLDFLRGRADAELAYLLSYTAVSKIYRMGGENGFRQLLVSWRETGNLDAGMRRSYGLTLGQFERLWREDVKARFGWLLVLSQTIVFWSILTVLLLILGYWTLRRRRRKLEELQARERWQVELQGIEGVDIEGWGIIDEEGEQT